MLLSDHPGPCILISGCGLPFQVALRVRPISVAELEEGATLIAHKVDEQVHRAVAGSHRGHRAVLTRGRVGICLPGGGRKGPRGLQHHPPSIHRASVSLMTLSRKPGFFFPEAFPD